MVLSLHFFSLVHFCRLLQICFVNNLALVDVFGAADGWFHISHCVCAVSDQTSAFHLTGIA